MGLDVVVVARNERTRPGGRAHRRRRPAAGRRLPRPGLPRPRGDRGHRLRPQGAAGDVALAVRSGRAPTTPDEVALGHQTATALGVHEGDHIRAETPDGSRSSRSWGRSFSRSTTTPRRVRGAAHAGRTRSGAGKRRVRGPAPRVPAGHRRRSPGEALGEDYGLTSPPTAARASLADFEPRRCAGVTVALEAFFGVVAVVGLIHLLTISARRRRLDFAVLRSLGSVAGRSVARSRSRRSWSRCSAWSWVCRSGSSWAA